MFTYTTVYSSQTIAVQNLHIGLPINIQPVQNNLPSPRTQLAMLNYNNFNNNLVQKAMAPPSKYVLNYII